MSSANPWNCTKFTWLIPEPEYPALYKEYLNCRVNFNAKDHMFVFKAKQLYMALPKANRLMKKKHEEECHRLYMRLKELESVVDKIYNELLFYEEGQVPMVKIAGQMNISTRTLRRHLDAEGATYQEILSGVLKKKAIDLLAMTELPIEKIAEKLGYSDTPNFYHAFKTWTGETPGKYRNAMARSRNT